MASSYCVKIHYGPCNSFYTVAHKPEKLNGLRDRLRTIGYRVILIPQKFENFCLLEICGHEVFRCNIKNLMFNTPYYLDPVCMRAVQAVVEASVKFQRARSHLWFWTLLQDHLFGLGEYQFKNYWLPSYELKPFAPLCDCVRCCSVLTSKKIK